MKKIMALACLSLLPGLAVAGSYGGVGVGYSEACRTNSAPGFSGGDCIDANIDIRGLIGHEFNTYFSIEGSLDGSFNGGHVVEAVLDAILSDATDNNLTNEADYETNRWSIVTLAASAFVHVPLGDSFRLFAGPSLGGSMVDFDYDVKYFGNSDSYQSSTTEFGFNYGWAAGAELFISPGSMVRLQWQNWHSLDAKVATNGKFNSNTLTLNVISYF